VLRNQRQRASRSLAATQPPTPEEYQHGRSLRILLVEDDELIRIATADLLQTFGHIVFDAPDAASALDILDGTTVDVLMTDIGLPGMSGSRLAAEARRTRPGLKVIFATGADGPASADGAAGPEGAFVLRKPYDSAALNSVLRSAGERRNASE
jgi:CheY-like chemotaxis protein